jgi:hypothetical protein
MKDSQPYLEHANLIVANLEQAIKFIQIAMPDFLLRGEGNWDTRRWVHIGTQESYLALVEPPANDQQSNLARLNHLGFVVPNATELAARLEKAGYKRGFPHTEDKFRIRDYFEDAAGQEYEFIQYLSEDPNERNAYLD